MIWRQAFIAGGWREFTWHRRNPGWLPQRCDRNEWIIHATKSGFMLSPQCKLAAERICAELSKFASPARVKNIERVSRGRIANIHLMLENLANNGNAVSALTIVVHQKVSLLNPTHYTLADGLPSNCRCVWHSTRPCMRCQRCIIWLFWYFTDCGDV